MNWARCLRKTRILLVYREYGYKLGLLFQLSDDLLDSKGDAKLMGKTVGKDGAKLSYPKVFGMRQSEEQCRLWSAELRILAARLRYGQHSRCDYSQELSQLAYFVAQRQT